jgi:hypothetical protein
VKLRVLFLPALHVVNVFALVFLHALDVVYREFWLREEPNHDEDSQGDQDA